MNLTQPTRSTWIEISKTALHNNVQHIRASIHPDCKLMGVIKANAYGHDASIVGQQLVSALVDYLAVATLGEALQLRQSEIGLPILVLGYTPAWLVAEAIFHKITLTIFDLETAIAFNHGANAAGKQLAVHVKVNSGMNRLGIAASEAVQLFAALTQLNNLTIEGIFTHYATSDLSDKSFAYEQFARFQMLLDQLTVLNLRPPIAHSANSAALLTLPETHLDMVRSGIAIYGLHPDPDETPLPAGFMPVLSWKAIIAQVTTIQAGESVSYGQEFVATHTMKVAVIPVGYADGFPRRPQTYGSVLIHGGHARILGRVCMDQTVVDVTEIDTVQPVRQGDEVVIIGRQGETEITIDDVASKLGTNNYDVVSRILSRVPRILVE